MEVAGERQTPGIPRPTLNNRTEILKSLKQGKLWRLQCQNCSAKIAVPKLEVVPICFLMRHVYRRYIRKLTSIFIIFVGSDLLHQVSVVPGCSKHIPRSH